MPVPKSRDPELARRDLERWLLPRLPDAETVAVTRFEQPRTSGFSNETILFDVETTRACEARRLELVARVAPTRYVLFPDHDLDAQRRMLEALAPTDVPVPRVLWHGEAPGSPFGARFFVMERVAGRAADDTPPYTKQGWLFDATPAEQRRVYVEGLRQLVRVAALDWEGLGVGFLVDPALGPPGLAQELAYWEGYLAWALAGRACPPLEETFAWLRAHAPDAGALCLSWGDSRPGNILYRDGRAAAVLDWEMASLSPRESDLGFWLAYKEFQSTGYGLPELPGFPDRRETIALYEELAGVAVRDVAWWELFGIFRLGAILVRLRDMMVETGVVAAGAARGPETPAFRVIETLRAAQP